MTPAAGRERTKHNRIKQKPLSCGANGARDRGFLYLDLENYLEKYFAAGNSDSSNNTARTNEYQGSVPSTS